MAGSIIKSATGLQDKRAMKEMGQMGEGEEGGGGSSRSKQLRSNIKKLLGIGKGVLQTRE